MLFGQPVDSTRNESPEKSAYELVLSFQQLSPQASIAKTDSVLAHAVFTKNSIWGQKSLALRLSYLRRGGAYEEVIKEGNQLFPSLTDEEAKFTAARAISISYRKIDQYESAMSWAVKLEKLAEAENNLVHLHRALQNMANLHSVLGEYTSSIKLERKLLGIADSLKNGELQVLDRCNLASSYIDLRQYDSAHYYFNEALGQSEQLQSEKYLALIHYNMGSLYRRQEEYPKAIASLTKCIEEASNPLQPDILSRAYYLMADCQNLVGSYSKAMLFLQKGYEFANEYHLLQDNIYLMELDYQMKQQKGDYNEAIAILEKLRVLEDSLLNTERIRSIKEMEAKYENEKKEREIDRLTSTSEIQLLTIKQQRILIVSVTAIFILAFVLVYLFIRQRSLKKDMQLVNTENQLLRSQMNPHFIFNALSAIQRFIYQQKDPVEIADYLGQFSRLTRMILENSSEELIRLDEEVEFIHHYLQLQQLRFDEPFAYKVEQEDDSFNDQTFLLPPMIVQPFIENAIEHGLLKKSEGNGELLVRFSLIDAKQLKIEVQDNGVGKSKSDFDKKNSKHRSMAIKITQERLGIVEKRYKGSAKLSVADREENGEVKGTLVTIVLPAITQSI
ncbi:MAG: histidine kinase [Cyclobacteriaceae bacterium]|nr:histidine kinase [Cyclobacteriaceae bacterium]